MQHWMSFQRQCMELMQAQQRRSSDAAEPLKGLPPPPAQPNTKELKTLSEALKSHLVSSVHSTIDRIISDYIRDAETRYSVLLKEYQQQLISAQHTTPNIQAALSGAHPFSNAFTRAPFYMHPFYAAANLQYMNGATNPTSQAQLASIFPSAAMNNFMSGWCLSNMFHLDVIFTGQHAQKDTPSDRTADTFSSFGLLPRKKRSKVTDTRMSKLPVHSNISTIPIPLRCAGTFVQPHRIVHPQPIHTCHQQWLVYLLDDRWMAIVEHLHHTGVRDWRGARGVLMRICQIIWVIWICLLKMCIIISMFVTWDWNNVYVVVARCRRCICEKQSWYSSTLVIQVRQCWKHTSQTYVSTRTIRHSWSSGSRISGKNCYKCV